MELNAFLVRFSASVWTARKMDKSATKDARERANATAKAGVRVYKSVLASDSLDKIHTIVGAARTEHEKRTVPWAYKGPGAITSAGYPAYKAAMAEHERAFNRAVASFIETYAVEYRAVMSDPSHSIRQELGSLFNPADYPAPEALRTKFSFAVSCEPMPAAADFRVQGLAPELVAEIKEDMAANNVAALANANTTAWGRVLERVEMLKARLTEYTNGQAAKFYNSWQDNVKELADLIPSINVTNDPDLTRMARRLVALTAYSNEDLKASESLRLEVIKQAHGVLADINEAHKQAA